MKFNTFLWDLYKKSERGKKEIRKYSRLTEQFIDEEFRELPVELTRNNEDEEVKEVSITSVDFFKAGMNLKFASLEKANKHFINVLVKKGIGWKCVGEEESANIQLAEAIWYDNVAAFSLGFHLAQPELFLPYNFRGKFNQLEEIHAEFGIPLPPVPTKRDKEGRGLYYLSINQAWHEFRLRYGLSPVEMCAFLYDFAQQFARSDTGDLPEPSRVWLISGGDQNFDFLDTAPADMVTTWTGKPDIRRGDILMMYLLKPRSRIDSIWRANSDGYIDPFLYYYDSVNICNRIKTEPVAFPELRKDPLLVQKPAVRAQFNGANGFAPFTVAEYEAILKIMESKGQDLSLLPQMKITNNPLPDNVLREEDVEKELIEPFLKRLGFREGDWERQMPVRMGRGERNYPDYALGANTKRGEESAKMILESKFQLSAQSDFKEAFYQTKSYALRLQSKIMAMAAREGIWVFPPDNGNFDIKKFVHKSWGGLNHPDHFHEILRLIGRDKVLGKR